MLELLSSMSSILISWLILFLVFSGLGTFILKMLGKSPSSGWRWLDGFWFGWAAALGFLQLWHLVFPVNDAVLLLLAASAMIAMFSQRRLIAKIARRLPQDKPFLLLVLALVLWVSNRALGVPVAYDTGFRDMQAVMWIDAYPLVPGLGNLFSSLAFNQSVYLYDALLDAFIWSGRSHHIATGLLILVYLVYATKAGLNLCRCRNSGELRWSWIFAALTMPYVLYYTATLGGISHFLTDTIVDLVGFVSMIFLLDFLQDWRTKGESPNYLVYRLALIIVTGLTIKQSFSVFAVMITVFAFAVWLQRCRNRPCGEGLARTLIPIAIAGCAFLLPWMVRGAITSGYVAYPHTFGRVNVDWAIPAEQLQERQLNMAGNTRLRGADRATVLGSWDWLGPWLRRFSGNIMPTMLPTLIALTGLASHAIGLLRSRDSTLDHHLSHWTLAPLLGTLLIWFLSFPEPKYVRYVLWSLAAIAVILSLQSWQTLSLSRRKLIVFVITALCTAYVAFLIIQLKSYPLPAGPDRGFYPLPPVSHEEYATDSGLTLNVPADGASQCWRIPLPCTPYPNPNLETRVPGELRHGFRVSDGAITGAAGG
ncbi:MAG: hypothetical protein OXG78_05145 [Chloroflexi bacterium]|nr:hypothetical protein [Chloroflexota bacterium]